MLSQHDLYCGHTPNPTQPTSYTHDPPLHPPLITQNPIPNYNLPMNYEPTIPPTDSHQNAKAITQWAHNHTKSTLTIDTYQPPDPESNPNTRIRPIITPLSHNQRLRPPKQITTTRCNEIDGSPTHQPTRLVLPCPLPHPTIPNDTPKNGSLNETEPNPPTTKSQATIKETRTPTPPHTQQDYDLKPIPSPKSQTTHKMKSYPPQT